MFRGGGDYSGNEYIIGSGKGALLCRYFSGRRHLSEQDQLTLEWAGAYHHYHAAMMRTLPVGKVPGRQAEMHAHRAEAEQLKRHLLELQRTMEILERKLADSEGSGASPR